MRFYKDMNGIFIQRGHDVVQDDYHEWVEGDRCRIDSRGRSNPRMSFFNARWWTCNNPECGATAYVLDNAVAALIESQVAGAENKEGIA